MYIEMVEEAAENKVMLEPVVEYIEDETKDEIEREENKRSADRMVEANEEEIVGEENMKAGGVEEKGYIHIIMIMWHSLCLIFR